VEPHLGRRSPLDRPATDVAIVTRLCEGYDLRERMRQQLAADGFMVEGSKRQQRPHPIVDKLFALDGLITRYEGLCGFTPADRARLGVAEVRRPENAGTEDFFARRRAERSRRLSGPPDAS
jgi:P27 family predicted phage terminase small subunit